MHIPERLWTRSFYLMSASNFLMSIAFYFLIPTLPVFITDILHASKLQVGLIFASYTLSALLIRPFAGFFLDSHGRRIILLISFFIFALLLGTYALVFSVFQLLMLRLLHGFSWGVTTTSFSTAIVDIIPAKRRGEGLGMFGLFMTIGMAIGPMLGLAISKDNHFDRMFLIAALLAMSGFVMLLFIKFPLFKTDLISKRFAWNKLIAPSSIPVSLIILLICFSYGGVIVFISLYAKEIKIDNSGIFFFIYAIGLGISRLFSGKIFDRSGPAKICFIGLTSLVLGLLILILFKNYSGFILAAFLLGIGFGITFPTMQAMVNHTVTTQQRGAANSTFFTAVDLGIGLGAVITGMLSDYISLSDSFLICALIIVIATILFYSFAMNKYKIQISDNEDWKLNENN
ncbi:MAG: MFS transporter [Bacteroidales bacterium]